MKIPVIKKLSDSIPYCNIMVYGDAGVGKTVLAGSDLRVLFLAPENDGTLSAIRTGSKADKIDIHIWEDLRDAYDYLYANPQVLEDYDWLVIDSITELQDMAKKYVVRSTAEEKKRKNQDPEAMQLQDYGTMHTLVENMVRGLNDLAVNVLYTATAKKVEDAEANEFMVPELQGKKEYGISMKMAALMTSYGYMRTEIHEIAAPTDEDKDATKNVKRRVIYWEDTGAIRGKDRTTRLCPYTVNATLQQLRKAINGELKRNSEGMLVKPAAGAPKSAMPATAKKGVVQASPSAEKQVESVTEPPKAQLDQVPPKLTGEVGQKFDKPVEVPA